ncbi:MAG: hypothetical protein U0401_21265 [Anaerolineae bacterium]
MKIPRYPEMLPYRKDDWRYQSDHQQMTYLAQRGSVGCLLDIRGTGSSPGLALDEYTSRKPRMAMTRSNGRRLNLGATVRWACGVTLAAASPPFRWRCSSRPASSHYADVRQR